MGGIALRHLGVRRINRAEYNVISRDVTSLMTRYFERVHVPPTFPTKADFGDIDVMVTRPRRAINDLVTRGIVQNGHVTSIEYKDVQVDLVNIKPESFDFNCAYSAWGDTGNILGAHMKRWNLKYVPNGLYLREPNLLLTNDMRAAHDFLGLDHDRFLRGFEDEVEVFEWLHGSPYCASGSIRPPSTDTNTNKRSAMFSRKVNKKRPMIEKYKEWAATATPAAPPSNDPLVHFGKQQAVEALRQHDQDVERYRQLFNGELVTELTGLRPGKELGDFIRRFKQQHPMDMVLGWTSEEVAAAIRSVALNCAESKAPPPRSM